MGSPKLLPTCVRAACRKWVIWPLLPSLWLIPAVGWTDETASIPTIARAWKKREEQVLSLDCEWSAEQTTGAKIWVYPDERGKQFALPPNDLTVSAKHHFRLKGNRKMRYEYTGPQPNQETRNFQTREYVSVTDGKEQKCFYGKDEASEEPRFPPLGFVNKEETLPENMTIHLWPLLVLYRPSTREVATGLDLTKYSPKGQIIIGKRECLLLERSAGGVEKHELVIDMNQECVPVRIRRLLRDGSTVNGGWYATSLVEINYVNQSDGSWRPGGWKTAILGRGGKYESR